MLVTVALVACVLGGAAAQSPLGRTAYVQLMAGCLGETPYREYLESVAAAGRECGVGLDERGFFSSLANILQNPSLARFPPGQGVPFSQHGGVVLQGPPGGFTPSRIAPHHPGLHPQLGGFPSQPGFLSQQPGILSQQPGILSQQPGILSQQPGILSQQPGILSQQPGILSQRPGVFTQQPGILSQQPGVFTQRPGVFAQQPGVFTQRPGVFTQQPGIFTQQQGNVFQRPGVTSQPGTFPQESGIFSSLVDSQSRATPVSVTDSVPPISSPIGPSFPGIRQRRAVALNLADIQQTREQMRALVNNFTCILNKLAVVNANLDLNHSGLTNSVVNLPVDRELKKDLLKAINYCKDMTQCLPLEKRQLPVPHKLKRVMEYVTCEKEMRLKACHKHNLRQSLQNINLGRLPHGGSQFNTVEEIVTLLVDAQSAHELELI